MYLGTQNISMEAYRKNKNNFKLTRWRGENCFLVTLSFYSLRVILACVPHLCSWWGVDTSPPLNNLIVSSNYFWIHTWLFLQVKSSYGIPGESPESFAWRNKQTRTRKKIAYIIIVLIVLFFICWLPRTVFIMQTFYGKQNNMKPWIHYCRIGNVW